MNVQRVKISELKVAPYNPEGRTRADNSRLKQLQTSMESETGLLYPILINKKKEVIDGHRRLVCAQNLGWDTIPALFVVDGVSREAAYVEANANAQNHSGNETLASWLVEPTSVTKKAALRFEKMKVKVGLGRLRKLQKRGLSITQVLTAEVICRYCDASTEGRDLIMVVDWLLEHRTNRLARSYIAMGHSAAELWKAIQQNRDMHVPDSKMFK